MSSATEVLILGASFAGVEVVRKLARGRREPLDITVVDQRREHGYIPLVHEALCERTEPPGPMQTAAYVDSLPGARFVQGQVERFDPATKTVTLVGGRTITARFVVVALGSTLSPPPALPGHEHLSGHKFADEVAAGHERLAELLRAGETPPRMVVVGGGLSGVELAGELAHLRAQRPAGWVAPEVTLVSADDRVLPELSPSISVRAHRALVEQGVDVRLSTRVEEVRPDAVVLRAVGDATEPDGGSTSLPMAAAWWCGGVRPAPVLARLGLPLTDDGWLSVGPTLQAIVTPTPTEPDIFACGDAVRVIGSNGRWATMQRAIECLWQAKVVAHNILRLAEHPAQYPEGVPGLRPHVLRPRFAYGVSVGARSLVAYGRLCIDLPALNLWFRRWLQRRYYARYAPRPGARSAHAES